MSKIGIVVTVPVPLAMAIAEGRKLVEFRKKLPVQSVEFLFVCGAGTGGKILAEAKISAIHNLAPVVAWKKYSLTAGVSEALFFEYVGLANTIGCIELTNAVAVTDKFLHQFGVKQAPQNFIYASL